MTETPTPAPAETKLGLSRLKVLQGGRLSTGLVALGLAAASQYFLLRGQTSLAAIGYIVAVVLFVIALRGWMPEDFTVAAPVESPATPAASTMLEYKSPAPGSGQLSFRTHWRYYTVADLLTGRKPEVPFSADSPVAPPPAEVAPEPVAVIPAVDPHGSDSGTLAQPPATAVAPIATADLAAIPAKQITVTEWTEFERPEAVLVTPQGHVLVLDSKQGVVFRFDPVGRAMGQWPVPDLPKRRGYTLAVSPDGKVLYIANPLKGRVQVITLED